ncbi:unnamed protein product [Phytophthora lilii]|uniref:Unnamed protein product n=1 Tax=Phytophthora lilii TaxID=2077276 RepID=A0A9W6TFA0_9STRA|nr:unnamed protein product [Phytophthora lilii]
MRLVLSTGEGVFCLCAIAVALYISPLFVDDGSGAWEFLQIWDDRDNFVENEAIQSGLNLANLYTMFTMTKINVYEPFGWILKAVQVQLVGLDSWWVRVVSAMLHFAAATVLARTAAMLLDVVALLSDFKGGSVRDGELQRQKENSHWHGCCISAMVLQSRLPRPSSRQFWSYIVGKLPVAATLLTFVTVMLVSNYEGMHPDADVLSLTLSERVIKSLTTPIWVLRQMMWPAKLRPHYQLRMGELNIANPDYLLSLVALMSLTLISLWLFQHQQAPQHLLAWVYFVVILLPVSGLIQHGMVSAGCDRYAYLCSIVAVPYGGSVFANWIGENNAGFMEDDRPEHVQPKSNNHHRALGYQRKVVIGVIIVVAVTLLDLTLLFVTRLDPSDWRILDQRATYLINSGRCTRDDDKCRDILELSYYFTPRGTLKSDLQRLKILAWLKQVDRACDGYIELLQLRPDSCHVHNNAAVCLTHRGELTEARQEFERALQTPGFKYAYPIPESNLKKFDEWVALVEDARARGEEGNVPPFVGQIMY